MKIIIIYFNRIMFCLLLQYPHTLFTDLILSDIGGSYADLSRTINKANYNLLYTKL